MNLSIKNLMIILFVLCAMQFVSCSYAQKSESIKQVQMLDPKETEELKQTLPFNFKEGERITYAIKKFGIAVGYSKLIYEGAREVNGVKTVLIVVKTKIVNFEGEEKIYLDTENYYPVLVERDIHIFGKHEQITEDYIQESHVLKITKRVKNKVTTRTVMRDGFIENIQGFIFRYRKQGGYVSGEEFDVLLPLVDVHLKLGDKTKVDINGQTFEAYYMEGKPKNLKIWFDSSPHHVPLRIDGNFGLGKVSMIFKNYEHRP